jgi:O-antigen biosynthesis protein
MRTRKKVPGKMEKISPSYAEIAQSGLFSAEWYLDQYQDVAVAGQDPLEHYLLYGAAEGRDPGPKFSTTGYLARYDDVADTGINPLLHYIRCGQSEGRSPKPILRPQEVKRPYGNFAEYLTHSLLDPLVKAPFSTVDLDNFRFMEQVARWLCRQQKECTRSPLVSVIMPMRDRAGIVGDAVRSVLAQCYDNFELLVVDDGSEDGSVAVIRSFTDTRIRILVNHKASGVSHARNRGLEAARGELVAYLDSDNSWRPDFLSAMVGVFQIRPDADAAYGGQYLYRGNENEPFGVRFGCYNPSLLRNHNYIDLNCFVHRSDILKEIGNGFCADIKRWVDWELILRIARVGKIYSVPILQSNYCMDKADNTITLTEELQPARRYIMNKVGYDGKNWLPKCEDRLTKKVVVIVLVRGAPENIDADMETLVDQLRNPLVQCVVVGATPGPAVAGGPLAWQGVGVQSIVIDTDGYDFHGIARALHTADPNCDLLLLDSTAGCTASTLTVLQKAAYACMSIGMTVPQHVLPGGEPTISMHVPYAFHDVPCDVTLSHQHRNVEALALLHGGGTIDLNYASFFCVYIKRDVWDLCGGFDARQDNDELSARNMCDFIRHVLGKRIVYTPDAVVLHGVFSSNLFD